MHLSQGCDNNIKQRARSVPGKESAPQSLLLCLIITEVSTAMFFLQSLIQPCYSDPKVFIGEGQAGSGRRRDD